MEYVSNARPIHSLMVKAVSVGLTIALSPIKFGMEHNVFVPLAIIWLMEIV
jgi:hypothetical protein